MHIALLNTIVCRVLKKPWNLAPTDYCVNAPFPENWSSTNIWGAFMSKFFAKAAFCAMALVGATTSQAAISVLDTATYGGKTYSLLSSDNWTASEAFAVANGGHLVAVNDAAENHFLISTWGSTKTLWIGLQRTAPGAATFAWSNGDALTYTNWAGGEPNNVGGNEDYVHTYSHGQWNDLANVSSYAGPQYGVMEVTAVPEPETYAMLLAGLGMLGMIARRRKSK